TPPLICVVPATLYEPPPVVLMFVVPALKPIVPVPLNVPSVTVCVPPPKSIVPGEIALKIPLLAPFALKLRTPARPLTVPLLLNDSWPLLLRNLLSATPPLFCSVPLLLNVPAPLQQLSITVPSLWISNRPALKTVAPWASRKLPVDVNVAVPLMLTVRASISMTLLLPLIVSGAAALNVVEPVPLMLPLPDHVDVPGPVTVRVPLPPNVPALRFTISVDAAMSKLAMPPLICFVPVTL